MAIYTSGGKILTTGGFVATDAACCCAVGACPCAVVIDIITTLNSSSGTATDCGDPLGITWTYPSISKSKSYAPGDFTDTCEIFTDENECCQNSACDGNPPPAGGGEWNEAAEWLIDVIFHCTADPPSVQVDVCWFPACTTCSAECIDCLDCSAAPCSHDCCGSFTYDLTDTGLHHESVSCDDGMIATAFEVDITF
jgi:hypothetical protein